jgi:hypothetical protein
MKSLQFIFLLLRRGTFFIKPVDFEGTRRSLTDSLQLNSPPRLEVKRSKLWKVPGLYAIMASLSHFRDRREMNKMSYVADSHKVIYVRILKAAGTSILTEFLKLLDRQLEGKTLSEEQVDALGYYFLKRNIPGAAAGYEKFTIVRDPYQRIVSVYLDLFVRSHGDFSYSAYWFGILEQHMTFNEFIKVISKIPLALLGPHFSPQTYILEGRTDTVIFRLEKDKQKLTDFLHRYNIELQHRNKHSEKYDYRSYYDMETFQLVSELYADDVRKFGYEDERKSLEQYLTT